MASHLDSFDLQLLAHLQRDARLPQAELGARVSLSTAAVNRRLKRLGEEGVIKRYTVEIEPAAVGYPLTVIVGVEAESERVDLLDATKRVFMDCPEVQQCYYVTGEWDFILILAVTDMAHYNALTRQLFFSSNNVKRFKTFVAMEREKTGMALPVGLSD
ncbi:Lrp/AsnC family transcriptional regulator [uncultured Comamonas sp.]|uniref:Lrp/AsnC family transcriptional regulator n=1 Tax=uncultured Comamonas sp. TaxID=114710 RepID=UPI003748B094